MLVIPSLKKAAFIVGGEGGSGVMSCRHSNGAWGTPIFMQLTKGSVGFQIGASSTELVLFVMNASGAEKLLSNKTSSESVPRSRRGRSGGLLRRPPTRR